MGDLISTTATTVKGLGNSSTGPRHVVGRPKKDQKAQEQQLKCARKRIETDQLAAMGISPKCK